MSELDEHDERDDEMLARLRALRDADVPNELEARVITSLRNESLLRRAFMPTWVLRAIAAAACVTLGVFVGRISIDRGPTPGAPMQSDFAMLLLDPERPDPRFDAGTPAQIFEQYAAWGREHGQRGELVLGEKLNEGRLMITEGDHATSLPPASGDAVQGLFLIRANSIEQARAIVATCPHVLRGGRVELRKIDGP